MSNQHFMNSTYLTAKQFLIRELAVPLAAEIVESYLVLPDTSDFPVPIDELFQRLLDSAQNANMKAGVIGGSIGGVHNLGKVLFNFDPKKVEATYKGDPSRLLEHIVKTLEPRGQIRTTTRSIWPKYSQTILSAAAFFTQFKDGGFNLEVQRSRRSGWVRCESILLTRPTSPSCQNELHTSHPRRTLPDCRVAKGRASARRHCQTA